MHVISIKRLREFWERNPEAESQLRQWYTVMKEGQFTDPHGLRRTFPTVDLVGAGRAVFDFGNRFRLVADLRYEWGRVFVVAVLTHAEYDKLDVTEL